MAKNYNINLNTMHHKWNQVPVKGKKVGFNGQLDNFDSADNDYNDFFNATEVLLPHQVGMVKFTDKIFIESLILEVRKSKVVELDSSSEPSTDIVTSLGNFATEFVNAATEVISSVIPATTSTVQDLTQPDIVQDAHDFLSKYELKEENSFIFVLISPKGTRSFSVISESILKQESKRIQLLQNAYFGEIAEGEWKLHIIPGEHINRDDLPSLDWLLSIYGTKTDISKNANQ